MDRYRLVRGLLIAGVVLGFGSGFVSLALRGARCGAGGWRSQARAEFVEEASRACVRAAREDAARLALAHASAGPPGAAPLSAAYVPPPGYALVPVAPAAAPVVGPPPAAAAPASP
jgi:hypothetical protein